MTGTTRTSIKLGTRRHTELSQFEEPGHVTVMAVADGYVRIRRLHLLKASLISIATIPRNGMAELQTTTSDLVGCLDILLARTAGTQWAKMKKQHEKLCAARARL